MDFRRYFLSYKGTQTEIKEPIGFDGFKPKLLRGISHGTIWEYAEVTLGFGGLSYDICKTAYENEGIEADVILIVQEKVNQIWDEFYTGRLDFAQYVEKKGNSIIIELGVAQIDVQTTIRNRINTKVELESLVGFDGQVLPEYPNLKKNILLEGKSVFTSSRAETNDYASSLSTRDGNTYFNIIFSVEVKSELFDLNAITSHDGDLNDVQPIFIVPDNDITYTNIRIKARYKVYARYTRGVRNFNTFAYYRINSESPINIGTPADDPYYGPYVIVDLDININLNAGDRFYLYGMAESDAALEWRYYIAPISDDAIAFFEVTGTSKYKSTNANLSLVHESLSRIVESITNGEITVKSDYYSRIDSDVNPSEIDGCGSMRGILTGLNLRNGLLTDGSLPVTYISLKDYLDALISIDCIGYGVQGNKLIVEPYKHFYNNDVIMTCVNVSNVERKVDLSRSYQLFNNGYKKWEAEEYNGIDGFHGKRQYRTSLKMIDTKLEKECSFVADGYAIEATRRRQIESDTKDWRYDNDVFIVSLERDIGNTIIVETGAIDPDGTVIDPDSIYNVSISPARNAMRWYSWIMQGVKDEALIFAGGEGYVRAKLLINTICSIETSVIKESQDILPSDFKESELYTPIFKPELISFQHPITRDDFNRIKSNPYGLIEFNGEYGWISEIEFDLLKCMADFTLIPRMR
ncbi:hypothetical protein CLV62_12519 [Dysgonomonas alginatilytica]|uniref:Uncharacterized protein n=1 Tax=Dysgonomonas alginatilytica TaxID=1605892 RepID=A0A2V3PLV9_9BACT|nr:hypothetical protein [Dysgonomonas alginatilytica]PXV61186.1 hypothetical protein CLV62_12519 [Dysgonomonas alginatilytica]